MRQHGSWRIGWTKILVVENAETAAGNEWGDITTAETEGGIRPEGWVGYQTWGVAVRIDRVFRQENWIVWRKWSGHDFINANTSPGQGTIDALNEASRIGLVGAVPDSCLFHGAANFSHAGEFG